MPPLAANIRFPWSDLLAWDFLLRYIRDITIWKNVSRSFLRSTCLVMRRAAYKYVTVSPSLEIWIEKGAINAAKTLSNLNPFEMCQGAHHSRSISQNEGLLAICFVKPFPPSEENWFLNMESWFWQQPWKKHSVLDDQSNKSNLEAQLDSLNKECAASKTLLPPTPSPEGQWADTQMLQKQDSQASCGVSIPQWEQKAAHSLPRC